MLVNNKEGGVLMRKFIDKHLTTIIIILVFGILMQGYSINKNIIYTKNVDREVNTRIFELENKVGELERRFEILNDEIK